MYTVFAVIKGKQGGEETAVSTGFANRGEASRFAVGLAKTGKTVRVEIREDPDPTLLETLLTWRERIQRTDPALPEGVHFDVLFETDLNLAIAVLDGDIKSLLTSAYNHAYNKTQGYTIDEAPGRFEFLEHITKAIEAFERLTDAERRAYNGEG